jgi:hypothetical protein
MCRVHGHISCHMTTDMSIKSLHAVRLSGVLISL